MPRETVTQQKKAAEDSFLFKYFSEQIESSISYFLFVT